MNESILIKLAQKASKDNSLIAWLVEIYRKSENKSWEQTSQDLGITSVQLARLSLCTRPRETNFAADILQTASYVGIDRGKLIRFVRHTEAIEVMKSNRNSQWLLAARDENPDPNDADGEH